MTARRAVLAFVVLCGLGTLTVGLPLTAGNGAATPDDRTVAERVDAALERTGEIAALESLAEATHVHYVAGLGIGVGFGASFGATTMYLYKRRQIEDRFA